jgi:hypothetical protein
MAGVDLLEATRPSEQAAVDLVAVVAGVFGDVADLFRGHEPAPGGKLPWREQVWPAADAVAVLPAVTVAARVGPTRLFATRPPIAMATSLAAARHGLAHRRLEEPWLRAAGATGPRRSRARRADEQKGHDGEHQRGACRAPPGEAESVHESRYRPAEPSRSAHSGRASGFPQVAQSKAEGGGSGAPGSEGSPGLADHGSWTGVGGAATARW